MKAFQTGMVLGRRRKVGQSLRDAISRSLTQFLLSSAEPQNSQLDFVKSYQAQSFSQNASLLTQKTIHKWLCRDMWHGNPSGHQWPPLSSPLQKWMPSWLVEAYNKIPRGWDTVPKLQASILLVVLLYHRRGTCFTWFWHVNMTSWECFLIKTPQNVLSFSSCIFSAIVRFSRFAFFNHHFGFLVSRDPIGSN